jgi:hypothetical protein
MENFKDYCKKVLIKESVNNLAQKANTGVLVTSWNSSSNKNVKHTIYYLQNENSFYQISSNGNDILEVKVIDANNLNDYSKWFNPEIFNTLQKVLEN